MLEKIKPFFFFFAFFLQQRNICCNTPHNRVRHYSVGLHIFTHVISGYCERSHLRLFTSNKCRLKGVLLPIPWSQKKMTINFIFIHLTQNICFRSHDLISLVLNWYSDFFFFNLKSRCLKQIQQINTYRFEWNSIVHVSRNDYTHSSQLKSSIHTQTVMWVHENSSKSRKYFFLQVFCKKTSPCKLTSCDLQNNCAEVSTPLLLALFHRIYVQEEM